MLAAPEFGIKLLAGPRKNIQVFKFIQKKLKKPTREQNTVYVKRGVRVCMMHSTWVAFLVKGEGNCRLVASMSLGSE